MASEWWVLQPGRSIKHNDCCVWEWCQYASSYFSVSNGLSRPQCQCSFIMDDQWPLIVRTLSPRPLIMELDHQSRRKYEIFIAKSKSLQLHFNLMMCPRLSCTDATVLAVVGVPGHLEQSGHFVLTLNNLQFSAPSRTHPSNGTRFVCSIRLCVSQWIWPNGTSKLSI